MGSTVEVIYYSNCITKTNTNCCNKEFAQYDDKGNIMYYYRTLSNLSNKNTVMIYDINEKEIGSIEYRQNCAQVNYTLYDEYKQMKSYIEERRNCCTTTYIIYNTDKSIESIITIKSGCCEMSIVECDKYNTPTNGATCKQDCCSTYTFNENDSRGNLNFIIRQKYDCSSILFKIYDPNEIELNFSQRSLLNDGFTNIQKIIILKMLFEADKQNNSAN
jgi:hypothetical protein